MDKNVLDRLFIIAALGLLIAGGIFLCISIFDGNDSSTPLNIALVCILFANLFNVIRQLNNKKD